MVLVPAVTTLTDTIFPDAWLFRSEAGVAASAALEALASVDPGAEARQRALQRQHLAQPAAEVGVAPPQGAVGIGPGEVFGRRREAAHVGAAELRDQGEIGRAHV